MPSWNASAELFRIEQDERAPSASLTRVKAGTLGLLADEVMALRRPDKDEAGRIIGAGEMVLFVAGERPLKGTQILYFDDPTFSRRARIPALQTRPSRSRECQGPG